MRSCRRTRRSQAKSTFFLTACRLSPCRTVKAGSSPISPRKQSRRWPASAMPECTSSGRPIPSKLGLVFTCRSRKEMTMSSNDKRNDEKMKELFEAAHSEGVLSASSLQVLTAVDLGAQIQGGLGISVDDVEAS